MAEKIPLKAHFTGADVTALGEFEPGDTVALAHLPPGLVTQGSSPSFDDVTVSGRLLSPRIGARAQVGAPVTVPSATFTIIPFAGPTDFDSHGYHDSAVNPSRFTVPAGLGGLYMPFLHVFTSLFAIPGRQFFRTFINGTVTTESAKSQPGFYNAGSSYSFGVMFPPVVLEDNDYFEFSIFQETGSDVTVPAGAHQVGGIIFLGT